MIFSKFYLFCHSFLIKELDCYYFSLPFRMVITIVNLKQTILLQLCGYNLFDFKCYFPLINKEFASYVYWTVHNSDS